PGNQVLPFGDLATIGFFISMAVGIHKGNLFRTVISGVCIMGMTIWMSNMMIGINTKLAEVAGSDVSGKIASLDQGGSPITFILTEIFRLQNIIPLIIIGVLYIFSVIFTYVQFKRNRI